MRHTHLTHAIGFTLALLMISSQVVQTASADSDTFTLKLAAPILRWDEAIPLGNGMLGGLLWGEKNTIHLSLDRGDLWDETTPPEILEGNWNYANMKQLIKDNWGEFGRRYDRIYNQPAPTKLPGGRLTLTLSPDRHVQTFSLDMKQALGTAQFDNGSNLQCFFPATERVALMRIADPAITCAFKRPDGLNKLKYPPAEFGQAEGMSWMVQQAADGLVYATLTATRVINNQTLVGIAIATNQEDPDEPDALALARRRVQRILNIGFDQALTTHLQWWNRFWNISDLVIPDERIQRHYNLVKYFYGAASRPDAPSMPLQAVWTQDSGGLPPWKGDFHHDLNTQMTYLAYHTAGLTDAGLSFLNHMWDLLPQYRSFARDFFGVEGAAIPAVMSLNGKPLGGWPQYALSPSYAIWIGQSFYLHWKHTMDPTFLRERAYPWLNEIICTIVQLLVDKDGKLYFELSSSSEIHNNSPKAYLTPNSNQDLAMLIWAFEAMAEITTALDRPDEAKKWRALRERLDDLAIDADNVLMFSPDEPFNQSHRHHAHVMAIHPFATLNIDGSDHDRQIITASLNKMDELGTQAWTGYSFSWFASLLARAGMPEKAYQYLATYEHAFILRNGFHCNGDQLKAGLSGFTYRPFTLEGNFLAMEAVHDMVLQSWPVNILKDPTPVIRLFPAMPWAWHNASFHNLHAEGGFLVSATRQNNATTQFSIQATCTGELRLRDNFGPATPQFNRQVRKVGPNYVITLNQGDTLTGHIPAPPQIPDEPDASTKARQVIQKLDDLPK